MTPGWPATSGIGAGHPAAPALLPAGGDGGMAGRRAARPVTTSSWRWTGRCFRRCRPATGATRRHRRWSYRCCSRAARQSVSWSRRLNRYRPLDDAYRGFVDAGRRTHRRGHRSGPQLPGAAAARRGTRRTRPRQDDVLLQHQPRVPHPADPDPRPGRRAAPQARSSTSRPAGSSTSSGATGLRLTKLVNTLLDFSRIEAGRAQASYEPVDLGTFTGELASVFRSAVERAGLVLAVDCAALGEPVYVDRDMWEKVIFNLLSNALKFTFEGTISVRARREGDRRGGHRRATPGSACPPTRCPGCSNASTASRTRGPGPTRAAASAWRWSRSSSDCTAAPSPPTARRGHGHGLHHPAAVRRRPPSGRRDRCGAGPAQDGQGGRRTCRRRCAGRPRDTGPAEHDPVAQRAVSDSRRSTGSATRPLACWSPTTTPTCANT